MTYEDMYKKLSECIYSIIHIVKQLKERSQKKNEISQQNTLTSVDEWNLTNTITDQLRGIDKQLKISALTNNGNKLQGALENLWEILGEMLTPAHSLEVLEQEKIFQAYCSSFFQENYQFILQAAINHLKNCKYPTKNLSFSLVELEKLSKLTDKNTTKPIMRLILQAFQNSQLKGSEIKNILKDAFEIKLRKDALDSKIRTESVFSENPLTEGDPTENIENDSTDLSENQIAEEPIQKVPTQGLFKKPPMSRSIDLQEKKSSEQTKSGQSTKKGPADRP
ncbi:MAG: hypothetical protein H2069_07740 [Legionella sp.]|nr:hypothetical protein [Legionella sp.]